MSISEEVGREVPERGASARRTPLRRDTKRKMALQERDTHIIAYIFTFQVASRRQIQERFGLSLHGVNRLMRRLYDGGFVERYLPLLPDQSPFAGQLLYGPGRQSAELLARRFGEDEASIRRRCSGLPGYLLHALMLTQIGSNLEQELRARGCTFKPLLVERQALDSYEVCGKGGVWKRQVVRPDALLPSCTLPSGARWHLAVECDRGSVASKPLMEKLVGYRQWATTGAMRQVHGSGRLAILIYTSGPERREHLLSYAQSIFSAPGDPLLAICVCDPHPAPLASSSAWRMLEDETGVSVFEALLKNNAEVDHA